MSKDYEFYMSHHISQVKDMTPEDQAKYKRGQAEFDRMLETRNNKCYYCGDKSVTSIAGVPICAMCGLKAFETPIQ